MRQYKYKKVNAFTSSCSKGNPAAYLYTGLDTLTHEEMLSVGKEHAGFVSEVVFAGESDIADVKLTYYSSECEVSFCGHGTIATMYDLIMNREELRTKAAITIETNRKGILTVYNDIDKSGAVYITAPKMQQLAAIPDIHETALALTLEENDIDKRYAMDFMDAGLRTLIVPVKDLQKEVSIYPDEEVLKAFCEKHEINIILTFCMTTADTKSFAHTRVFAPRFGYLEDPATGSGNSAFANYLLKYNMWDGNDTVIEQGGDNIVYNPVNIKTLKGDILFGGRATTIIDGTYTIF